MSEATLFPDDRPSVAAHNARMAALAVGGGLARRTDPRESHEAGEAVRPHLSKMQEAVVRAYTRWGPMSARTAEELPDFEGYGFSTVRKRISELVAAGVLRQVGTDRSGRAPCAVYSLVGDAPVGAAAKEPL